MVLRAYPWVWTQISQLAALRGPYVEPEIEPWLATYKATTLQFLLPLWPKNIYFQIPGAMS